MLIALTLALFIVAVAVGAAIAVDTSHRRRTARDADDEREAARLRLVAAGEDPDAPHIFAGDGTGNGTVYQSKHSAPPPDEPLDQRTAAIVVDPTLSVAERTQVIAHVEHGAGSLASFAATACDTREMRTHAEQHHLEAVYDDAHDENTARDLDAVTVGLWTVHGDVWAAINAWVERYHGKTHYAACAHCAKTLHEQSDEFAQLVTRVESEHTGEISKTELDELLNAPVPALFRA